MIGTNSLKLDKKLVNTVSQECSEEIKVGLTKEQLLSKNIKKIANDLVNIEAMKNKFARIVLKNQEQLDFSEFIQNPKFFIKESELKKQISPSNINGLKIVSVDGSSVVKKYLNVNFSFLKAIVAKYRFIKNYDAVIEFFPDLSGYNNYMVRGNFINDEENVIDAKVSLDMNFMEINLLNNLIEKSTDIDLIVLDGPVLITPINLLFSKDIEISKKYDSLLKEYHKLYSNCEEKGTILIGSIKDTRTAALSHLLCESIQLLKPSLSNLTDFIEINYRQVMEYFSDLDLFNRVLKKSERSCIFNCKLEIDNIRESGIKKKIPDYFPLTFYAFYLKTVLYDTPCRFEFFINENHKLEEASKKADLISSILLPISNLNEYYGLPIPQIEAHKRAVFKSEEINLLFNNLIRRLHEHGITLLEKRRNRRPF